MTPIDKMLHLQPINYDPAPHWFRLACDEALNPRTWLEVMMIVLAMVGTTWVVNIIIGGGYP
jgi:hypothetical protein